MAGYRRFVAYVYEYRKGKKEANCGYIRVEVKEQRCRLEVHLRCPGLPPAVECRLYGFVRNQGLMDAGLIGVCRTRDGSVEVSMETNAMNMGDSGIPLRKMGGMILRTESGAFFGTEWDDETIRPENFREVRSGRAEPPAEDMKERGNGGGMREDKTDETEAADPREKNRTEEDGPVRKEKHGAEEVPEDGKTDAETVEVSVSVEENSPREGGALSEAENGAGSVNFSSGMSGKERPQEEKVEADSQGKEVEMGFQREEAEESSQGEGVPEGSQRKDPEERSREEGFEASFRRDGSEVSSQGEELEKGSQGKELEERSRGEGFEVSSQRVGFEGSSQGEEFEAGSQRKESEGRSRGEGLEGSFRKEWSEGSFRKEEPEKIIRQEASELETEQEKKSSQSSRQAVSELETEQEKQLSQRTHQASSELETERKKQLLQSSQYMFSELEMRKEKQSPQSSRQEDSDLVIEWKKQSLQGSQHMFSESEMRKEKQSLQSSRQAVPELEAEQEAQSPQLSPCQAQCMPCEEEKETEETLPGVSEKNSAKRGEDSSVHSRGIHPAFFRQNPGIRTIRSGLPAGSMRRNTSPMPDRSAESREKAVSAPETKRGAETADEPFEPFSDGFITDCRRIQIQDLRRLDRRDRMLCGNRFVQHGYYRFGHLLLGKMESGGYILGIPGTYDQQERFMAGMFGFPYFRESALVSFSGGRGGYWYRSINPPNFH